MPVLVALSTAYTLLESLLGPAVPVIQKAFSTTPAAAAWIFTGLTLAGVISMPLVTRLTDVRDKRPLFLAVTLIVCIGVLISGTAPSIAVLAVGQVLQGVGLALLPLSISVARATQPEKRIKRANGLLVGAALFGSAPGVLLAGPLLSVVHSFRWLYFIPLFILVPLTVFAFWVIPSLPARHKAPVDFAGAALLGTGLTVLLVGLTLAPTTGWASPTFLIAVGIALVLLATFVAVERRIENPLVDFRLGGRIVITVCLLCFAAGYANMTLFVALPTMAGAPAATGYGLAGSTTLAGLLLLPMAVLGTIAAALNRPLRVRIGSRGVMVLAGLLLVASVALILVNTSVAALALSSTLIGAGIGFGLTEAVNLAVENVPADRVASVTGLVYISRNTGATFGAQIGSSILATALIPTLGVPSWSGLATMFSVALVVAIAAMAGGAAVPGRKAAATAAVEVSA
jgi:MFS family permease